MTSKEAIEVFQNYESFGCAYCNIRDDEISAAIKKAIEALENERKKGQWEMEADGYADGSPVYDMWSCPNCGHVEEVDDPDELPKYCPRCGTRLYVPVYEYEVGEDDE